MKITLTAFFVFVTIASFCQIKFPIKASDDKKYLVDQAGTPFFLNGCSLWRMPYAISYEEVKFLLEDRKKNNFNAIEIMISPDVVPYSINPDTMPVGANAFFDNDINKPNERYFKHVDSVLKLCNEMNIAVVLAPLYLGCCKDGWLEIIQQYKDGEAKCREYGKWFAKRYKHLPNLIWLNGGDHNPVPESIAFGEGVASVDTTHLHTSHAHPGKSSAERLKGVQWQTLSSAYTYFPAMETDTAWQYKHVYTQLYEEMLMRYKMPVILLESAYERERHTTTQTLRRQAYWALLSGASGAFFGHRDLYQLQGNWRAGLKDPGSKSMKIFYEFVKTIPWHRMRADWPHSLFVSGRGTFNSTIYPGGEDYAAAMFTPDSTIAAIYLPTNRKVGVNMSRFKKQVTATWLDPSSGVSIKIPSAFRNAGIAYFAPPAITNKEGAEDWVLVLKPLK